MESLHFLRKPKVKIRQPKFTTQATKSTKNPASTKSANNPNDQENRKNHCIFQVYLSAPSPGLLSATDMPHPQYGWDFLENSVKIRKNKDPGDTLRVFRRILLKSKAGNPQRHGIHGICPSVRLGTPFLFKKCSGNVETRP